MFSIAEVEIGLQSPAAHILLATRQHLGAEIESGKLHARRQIFEVEPGADRGFKNRITGLGLEQAHVIKEVRIEFQAAEGAEKALGVVVETANGFVKMVVLSVVAGEVFRVSEKQGLPSRTGNRSPA